MLCTYAIGKCKLKLARCHNTPIKTAKIQNTNTTKCSRGVEQWEPHSLLVGMQIVQLLQKIIWQVFKAKHSLTI